MDLTNKQTSGMNIIIIMKNNKEEKHSGIVSTHNILNTNEWSSVWDDKCGTQKFSVHTLTFFIFLFCYCAVSGSSICRIYHIRDNNNI